MLKKIISGGQLGANYSQKMTEKYQKPCLIIDLNETPSFVASSKINTWIIKNDIEVMNLTGSRVSEDSNVYRDTVYIIEDYWQTAESHQVSQYAMKMKPHLLS